MEFGGYEVDLSDLKADPRRCGFFLEVEETLLVYVACGGGKVLTF
jgi:D-serine dehydratase